MKHVKSLTSRVVIAQTPCDKIGQWFLLMLLQPFMCEKSLKDLFGDLNFSKCE